MATLSSPTGKIMLHATQNGMCSVEWLEGASAQKTKPRQNPSPSDKPNPHTTQAKQELTEYFTGTRKIFSVPTDVSGTAFQRAVWAEMLKIPFGETRTYSDLAKALNSHPRAVGMACGKNPLPLIIPCHRVLGKNGALTGFSGGDGVNTKSWLLAHEQGESLVR